MAFDVPPWRPKPELIDGEAFLDKPFTVRGLLEAVALLKTGFINEPPPPESPWRRMLRRVRGAEGR